MAYYRLYQLRGPKNRVETFHESTLTTISKRSRAARRTVASIRWNSGPATERSAGGKESMTARLFMKTNPVCPMRGAVHAI